MSSGTLAAVVFMAGLSLTFAALLMRVPPRLPPVELRAGDCIFQGEVATAGDDQARGLSGRAAMPPDYALVFPLTPGRSTDFWMKNTPVALSIAFVAPDGVVLSTVDMQPESLETVPSGEVAAFAIEVSQGRFESCGVRAGTWTNVGQLLIGGADRP